jgi:hypothetical protein
LKREQEKQQLVEAAKQELALKREQEKQQLEEREELAREAAETLMLQKKAEEEDQRLAKESVEKLKHAEAEEMAKVQNEQRLAREAEEKLRLQKEAELVLQLEEISRLQKKAEEEERLRLQKELEEKLQLEQENERVAKETEKRLRLEKEAEGQKQQLEKERLAKAEESSRLQLKADDKVRLEKENEQLKKYVKEDKLRVEQEILAKDAIEHTTLESQKKSEVLITETKSATPNVEDAWEDMLRATNQSLFTAAANKAELTSSPSSQVSTLPSTSSPSASSTKDLGRGSVHFFAGWNKYENGESVDFPGWLSSAEALIQDDLAGKGGKHVMETRQAEWNRHLRMDLSLRRQQDVAPRLSYSIPSKERLQEQMQGADGSIMMSDSDIQNTKISLYCELAYEWASTEIETALTSIRQSPLVLPFLDVVPILDQNNLRQAVHEVIIFFVRRTRSNAQSKDRSFFRDKELCYFLATITLHTLHGLKDLCLRPDCLSENLLAQLQRDSICLSIYTSLYSFCTATITGMLANSAITPSMSASLDKSTNLIKSIWKDTATKKTDPSVLSPSELVRLLLYFHDPEVALHLDCSAKGWEKVFWDDVDGSPNGVLPNTWVFGFFAGSVFPAASVLDFWDLLLPSLESNIAFRIFLLTAMLMEKEHRNNLFLAAKRGSTDSVFKALVPHGSATKLLREDIMKIGLRAKWLQSITPQGIQDLALQAFTNYVPNTPEQIEDDAVAKALVQAAKAQLEPVGTHNTANVHADDIPISMETDTEPVNTSTPSANVGVDEFGGNVQMYRQALLAFYFRVNPEKVEEIDSLLTKYKGNEVALLARIEKKYKEPVIPGLDLQKYKGSSGAAKLSAPQGATKANAKQPSLADEQLSLTQSSVISEEDSAVFSIPISNNSSDAAASGLSQLVDAPLSKDAAAEYEVVFETKRKLGVIFTNRNESAVVKSSEQDSIHVGSVLLSINEFNVGLQPYRKAMLLLVNSTWPLKLRFMAAVLAESSTISTPAEMQRRNGANATILKPSANATTSTGKMYAKGIPRFALDMSAEELVSMVSNPCGIEGVLVNQKLLNCFILDCRPEEQFCQIRFGTSLHIHPDLLASPDPAALRHPRLEALLLSLVSLRGEVQICLLGSGAKQGTLQFHKETLILARCYQALVRRGFPYISVVKGGFAGCYSNLSKRGLLSLLVGDMIDSSQQKDRRGGQEKNTVPGAQTGGDRSWVFQQMRSVAAKQVKDISAATVVAKQSLNETLTPERTKQIEEAREKAMASVTVASTVAVEGMTVAAEGMRSLKDRSPLPLLTNYYRPY